MRVPRLVGLVRPGPDYALATCLILDLLFKRGFNYAP